MKNGKLFLIILVLGFLMPTNFVFATTSTNKVLDSINSQNQAFETGSKVGTPTDIRIIVARIIKIFLGFVGLLATVYLVYGGYLYMSSAGNDTQVANASKIMLYSALGLFVILGSYAIVNFVYKSFQDSLYQIDNPDMGNPMDANQWFTPKR
ncbi:MAG: pilin [Candidatus Magasanikbacteria bacterium]